MDFINSYTHQADLKYVRSSMNIPLLKWEHEKQLTRSWHHSGNKDALHALVKSYIRLVVSIAFRYRYYGLPLSDLIQEGNIGLLQAAEKFDPKREVRFSAYAKWWIRACIQDYILKNWSIVRTGSTTSQKTLFFNLNRLKRKLLSLKETMDHDEKNHISEILQVSIQDVQNMESRLAQHDLSLSANISENDERNFQDLLSDNRPTPEEESVRKQNTKNCQIWIKNALTHLPPLEQLIISRRWLSDSSENLDKIAKDLKITKERVRHLEAKAIRKLRHFLIENFREARQLLD